jgi:hypothetical protein
MIKKSLFAISTSVWPLLMSAVGLLTICSAADANIITWNFTGTVVSQTDSGHAVGDIINGSFSFDSSTPVTILTSVQANYENILSNFTVAQFQSTSLINVGSIVIQNNENVGGFADSFVAGLDDLSGQLFDFQLREGEANPPTAITSLELPSSPYNLSDFPVGPDFFSYSNNQGIAINATLDSISQTPIPATLPLFAGGLGVVGLFGRRRKQKHPAIFA